MKQLIQSYRTGALELADLPAPAPAAGCLRVRTLRSVVSAGTERSMLELARRSLIGKAVARPDLVRQVVSKVRSEGLAEAYRQSMGRLDNPVPLGYSSSGVVLDVGPDIDGFAEGDRVACSGSGFASHAEIVRIPSMFAVRVPNGVDLEEAAFAALGGIALHGVRTAEARIGERVVVLGLGLLGLLAVQILKAAGCRVMGADISPGRLRMARQLGADTVALAAGEDLGREVRAFSQGYGADAVLIFAATASNEPIEQAAEAARDGGRIVAPGLVGLEVPRKAFYEKELSLRVSRAWGAGVYDAAYERMREDYPLSQIRWSAQRNTMAFLEMLASGDVRVAPLISHRFPLEQAVSVYERILSGRESFTGIVLTYPESPSTAARVDLGAPGTAAPRPSSRPRMGRAAAGGDVRVGLVGAGLYARGTLLPALRKVPDVALRSLATSTGLSGHHVGRKYGFAFCTTQTSEIIQDPEIDLVMVLTRHGTHARLASEALRAGKHVFVEKPLALNETQLAEVIEAHRIATGQLMVGFNRRYAPTIQAALEELEAVAPPLMVTIRVNAGAAPAGSWVHDPAEGGGPILGEACHFFDLAQALTRSLPVKVHARALDPAERTGAAPSDLSVTLAMANGSVATIVYATGGDRTLPRERVEIFGGGAACLIDNFRTMIWSRGGRRRRVGRPWSGVDRGHEGEMRALIGAIKRGEPFPVGLEEYVATTRATFAALESHRTGQEIAVVPAMAAGEAECGSPLDAQEER